jgi:hypothetical protein
VGRVVSIVETDEEGDESMSSTSSSGEVTEKEMVGWVGAVGLTIAVGEVRKGEGEGGGKVKEAGVSTG